MSDDELNKELEQVMREASKAIATETLDACKAKVLEQGEASKQVHFGYINKASGVFSFETVVSAIGCLSDPISQNLAYLLGKGKNAFISYTSSRGSLEALIERNCLTIRTTRGSETKLAQFWWEEAEGELLATGAKELDEMDLNKKQQSLIEAFIDFSLSPRKLRRDYPQSWRMLAKRMLEQMGEVLGEGEALSDEDIQRLLNKDFDDE